jgi:hypothetical protein
VNFQSVAEEQGDFETSKYQSATESALAQRSKFNSLPSGAPSNAGTFDSERERNKQSSTRQMATNARSRTPSPFGSAMKGFPKGSY